MSKDEFDLVLRQKIQEELTDACLDIHADFVRVILVNLMAQVLADQPSEKVAGLRKRIKTVFTENAPLSLSEVTDKILEGTL